MQAVRQVIEQNPSMATELSGATTLAEQREAELRKVRSDLGATRAPYMTRKKAYEETKKQIEASYTPEQAKQLKELLKKSQLEEARAKKQPGAKPSQAVEEDEPMAKTSAPKRGRGLKNQFRKPAKRQVKVSPEEKKKDRLRLVVAQIQAGNTNPKLIQEVNKLYKDLYDIDGAYMMLKR